MISSFFDRLDVDHRIAFGAFGAIYQVKDRETNQDIALKVEKTDSNHQLLLYEYNLLKSLQDSSHIVKVFDYFETKMDRGMTMELLFNTLVDIRHLRRNKPSIPMLLYIAKECLTSISYIHAKDLLHHDIKPSNFLIKLEDHDYKVILIDFGLCESQNEPQEVTKFRYNLDQNLRYHSIDCYGNKNWSKREDLVSLVYTLADFWSDGLPWDGRTSARLIQEEKVKHSLESLIPEELHFLVRDLDKGADFLLHESEDLLKRVDRNVEEEILYLTKPLDPGYKRKVADIVVEPELKAKFKNQHSA